jgi:superfamily I DNA/RNA helicase
VEGPAPLPEQRRFIECDPTEHALLVAGPGTGKTFTIERRARFLVEERGVDPDRIALLTLTRSLVESLAERVPYGHAQTFHSFALVWLNRLGEAWDRRVVAPNDVHDLVRLDLQHGVELEFDVTIPRDRIGAFVRERLSAAFRDEQDQPPT